MLSNLSKVLFLMMLVLGTIISISANSWLGVWVGLEVNLISFIPLMTNKINLNNSEASLNYFLIQAFASSIILFSVIIFMTCSDSGFFMLNQYNKLFTNISILMPLMLKLGAAPFHFWFPNVMENLNWTNNLILMTWQKVAPMMIMSYLNMTKMLMMFIIMSTLVGAIGGLNQMSLRKLMAFSSINHIGWMITSLMFNESMWLLYFILYTYLNFSMVFMFKILQIFYLNQMYSLFMNSYLLKFSLLSSMLSLGGLPPFLGFLPKWMVIQSLLFMKLNLLTLFMILMSLITLYYYLKISFAAFMLNHQNFNWNFKNLYNRLPFNIMLGSTFFSLFGFFLSLNLIYIIN